MRNISRYRLNTKIVTLLAGVLLFSANSYALNVNDYPVLVSLIEKMSTEDGYPTEELTRIISKAEIDQKTLALMDKQWESLPWHKYRKLFINDNRIELGVKFWNTYKGLLDRAYDEFGIPPEVIVALIGVETHYGTRIGDKSVLTSLVTLSAAYPRRSKFFTAELRTFLNMTRKEQIPANSVVGSFAGAIGIPQFMPSSYQAYAVDFNVNGKRDLVNETADAIGSVANYLSVHGWNKGQRIYANVGQSISESAKKLISKKAKLKFSKEELISKGVNFDPSNGSKKVALVSLSQASGKSYFVVYRNFYAITRYNPSTNYAMAVTQLSEAISKKRSGI